VVTKKAERRVPHGVAGRVIGESMVVVGLC